MESVGGKVEAFYFTYGQDDVIVLLDADVSAAAAISLAVNESCSSNRRRNGRGAGQGSGLPGHLEFDGMPYGLAG